LFILAGQTTVLQNNFTPVGLKTSGIPQFPRARQIVQRRDRPFKAGLYVPLYSISKNRRDHLRWQAAPAIHRTSRRTAHVIFRREFGTPLQLQTLGFEALANLCKGQK
jgi:hypothetical protein